MSDPFDVLRTSARGGAPDVGAIKSRARRIERRRRVAISSAAVVIVAVAVGGVLLRPGGGSSSTTTVAQSQLNTTASPEAALNSAAAPAAPSPTSASVAGSAAQTHAADQRAASKSASGGQRPAAMAAPAPPQDSGGSLQLTVAAAGAGPHMERFTLKACNPSSSAVAPTFPTGQRYDFEVRRNGSLVWRWSDGMAFTQIYGQESWAPKQCKTYTATWNAAPQQPTGSYQVTGILASSPRQSTAPKAFCLDLC